jgi:excisionase family DNA binding protein
MMTQTDRLAVSIRDAATILGISPRSVQKYVAAKVLPARKIGRRTLIPFSALEAFLRKDQPSPFVKQDGCGS